MICEECLADLRNKYGKVTAYFDLRNYINNTHRARVDDESVEELIALYNKVSDEVYEAHLRFKKLLKDDDCFCKKSS